MALSTLDIAEDILAVVPLSNIYKGAKAFLPKGLIKTVGKTLSYSGNVKQ